MGTDTPTTQPDKQITIAVPEDRVPEFYAFYARFLAGAPGRRGRRRGGPGHHGPCGGHHHRDRCHPHHHEDHDHPAPERDPAPAA